MIRAFGSMTTKMRGTLVSSFGGIQELKLTKDLPVPELEQNQVLVQIYSSGVNPVDTYIRSGTYPVKPSLPYIPGKDGAGIVEKVGKNVRNFKIGDRVFCSAMSPPAGTLAEYLNLNEECVFPLSSKLSFDEGAALGVPYFTAHKALFISGRAKPGQKLLIHGASGAVGMAAIQMAKAIEGMVIVGTAGTQGGLERIRALGAHDVYCHRDSNYQELLQQNHSGFDVILEMLSNVNLQKDLELMAPKGITVVIGCRGEITINPRLLMGKESYITGCNLVSSTEEERNAAKEAILSGIENNFIKPTIGRTFSLEQVGEAHDYIINNSGTEGKVIVKIKE